MFKDRDGFVVLDLLIIVVILIALLTVAYITINPGMRARDARDMQRWSDISGILTEIHIAKLDSGSPLGSIANRTSGTYMIGAAQEGCDMYNDYCNVIVDKRGCVNLEELVLSGYLSSIPVSPKGEHTWDSQHTGYTLTLNESPVIRVDACESEGVPRISISR